MSWWLNHDVDTQENLAKVLAPAIEARGPVRAWLQRPREGPCPREVVIVNRYYEGLLGFDDDDIMLPIGIISAADMAAIIWRKWFARSSSHSHPLVLSYPDPNGEAPSLIQKVLSSLVGSELIVAHIAYAEEDQ